MTLGTFPSTQPKSCPSTRTQAAIFSGQVGNVSFYSINLASRWQCGYYPRCPRSPRPNRAGLRATLEAASEIRPSPLPQTMLPSVRLGDPPPMPVPPCPPSSRGCRQRTRWFVGGLPAGAPPLQIDARLMLSGDQFYLSQGATRGVSADTGMPCPKILDLEALHLFSPFVLSLSFPSCGIRELLPHLTFVVPFFGNQPPSHDVPVVDDNLFVLGFFFSFVSILGFIGLFVLIFASVPSIIPPLVTP